MCTLDTEDYPIGFYRCQEGHWVTGQAAREQEMDDVLAVNVPEAARRLGVSPRTVATLVACKELPSRKIGRRRVIPVAALEAFLRKDHPIPVEPKDGKG